MGTDASLHKLAIGSSQSSSVRFPVPYWGAMPNHLRSYRLLDIRMGQEARCLPQQQGGSHCPLRGALNSILLFHQ